MSNSGTEPYRVRRTDERLEDHLYDALRYGVMSRQAHNYVHPAEREWQNRSEKFEPSDGTFGY